MSTTVRVSRETHEILRSISDQTGETIQSILEKAVAGHRKRLFWERTNAAFAALRNDPKAWQEEQEERSAWDATLTDDLEDG